jgi:hypothetical protein
MKHPQHGRSLTAIASELILGEFFLRLRAELDKPRLNRVRLIEATTHVEAELMLIGLELRKYEERDRG